jgi:hypothetical protein
MSAHDGQASEIHLHGIVARGAARVPTLRGIDQLRANFHGLHGVGVAGFGLRWMAARGHRSRESPQPQLAQCPHRNCTSGVLLGTACSLAPPMEKPFPVAR